MPKPNHTFEWKRDKHDSRDLKYQRPEHLKKLPASVDLRQLEHNHSHLSAVENQGGISSCTANALAGNLEFLELKTHKEFYDVSRLFIYYNERVIEGIGYNTTEME